jgi:peptidoglycan/LPS O-acetylase OafA/YrhL
MVMVLAACLTVSLAIGANPVSTALRSRGPKWLGQRSYSLYLVHEPIVVTIAFLVGGRPQAVPLLLVALPVSLLAADLFWRAIERPAVGLARSAGRSTAVVVRKASLRRSRPDVRPAL